MLVCILVSSAIGTGLGFAAGLVPGLHMNNIAAALCAYSSLAASALGTVGGFFMVRDTALLISCFISAALVAHLFAQSITSAYVGIPSEDVVSVLPAHRLAKAGFGRIAVLASADGCMAGVLVSIGLLLPACVIMGPPIELYSWLRRSMVVLVLLFSTILLASEGAQHSSGGVGPRLAGILKGLAVFLTAGALGVLVLQSNYYASRLPDFPWISHGFVMKSSLLLPMFAGLFGVPGLLLSLGSRSVTDISSGSRIILHYKATTRDLALSVFGGLVVGWLPGMTSGSAVALCSPRTKEVSGACDFSSALRFIWLYSSISASGSVFAVGALFTIMRARSGSMDAIESFLGSKSVSQGWLLNFLPIISIALAMLVAALISLILLRRINERLTKLRSLLCSRELAISSLVFVSGLSLALTGVRGALLMGTAAVLGIIPPLCGVRRIQLMGCLLVPIMITLLE